MSSKYLFSQGNASFEKGDYPRAISFYCNAIDLNPEDIKYYKGRCISFLKTNNFIQAIRDANIVVSKNPESDSSYILLGISYLTDSQIEKAEDAFVRAHQINPNNMITQNYLGKIQQNRQNGFKTLPAFDQNFQEIFQQYLQEPETLNNFAGNVHIIDALNNYMDMFDRPTTVKYQNMNNEIIRYQNKDSLNHILSEAKSNFKQNQFQESIKLCQQGVMQCNENTPSSTIASLFQIITSSYMKMNQIDEAVNYSHHFIEISQKNGFEITDTIQKNCEYIQIASQNFKDRLLRDRALAYYSQFRKSDTDILHFFREEITNSLKNNQIEKAAEVSSYAVSLHPSDIRLLYSRAKVNYKLSQFDLSIDDCLKIVRIQPTFSKAHLLLARCFLAKNEPKKSLVFCRRSLLYDRENRKAVELVPRIDEMIRVQKEQKMNELLRKREEMIQQQREREIEREREEQLRQSNKENERNNNNDDDDENDQPSSEKGRRKRKRSFGKSGTKKQVDLNGYPHSEPLPTVRQFNEELHIGHSPFPASFHGFNGEKQNKNGGQIFALQPPGNNDGLDQPRTNEEGEIMQFEQSSQNYQGQNIDMYDRENNANDNQNQWGDQRGQIYPQNYQFDENHGNGDDGQFQYQHENQTNFSQFNQQNDQNQFNVQQQRFSQNGGRSPFPSNFAAFQQNSGQAEQNFGHERDMNQQEEQFRQQNQNGGQFQFIHNSQPHNH